MRRDETGPVVHRGRALPALHAGTMTPVLTWCGGKAHVTGADNRRLSEGAESVPVHGIARGIVGPDRLTERRDYVTCNRCSAKSALQAA